MYTNADDQQNNLEKRIYCILNVIKKLRMVGIQKYETIRLNNKLTGDTDV